jgi:hypothetical protein
MGDHRVKYQRSIQKAVEYQERWGVPIDSPPAPHENVVPLWWQEVAYFVAGCILVLLLAPIAMHISMRHMGSLFTLGPVLLWGYRKLVERKKEQR